MEMSIIKLNQPTLIGQVELDRLLVFQVVSLHNS